MHQPNEDVKQVLRQHKQELLDRYSVPFETASAPGTVIQCYVAEFDKARGISVTSDEAGYVWEHRAELADELLAAIAALYLVHVKRHYGYHSGWNGKYNGDTLLDFAHPEVALLCGIPPMFSKNYDGFGANIQKVVDETNRRIPLVRQMLEIIDPALAAAYCQPPVTPELLQWFAAMNYSPID